MVANEGQARLKLVHGPRPRSERGRAGGSLGKVGQARLKLVQLLGCSTGPAQLFANHPSRKQKYIDTMPLCHLMDPIFCKGTWFWGVLTRQ